MNFEKNDFVRNVVPGYIYFIVILSFYLINGQVHDLFVEIGIIDKEGKSTEIASLLGLLVSGYPIGFILSNIYRFFHLEGGGHNRMEHMEARMLEEVFSNPDEKDLLKNIPSTPTEVFTLEQTPGRNYSWFMELFLIEHGKRRIHERLQATMSWMHALGGAVAAIGAAFITLVIVQILMYLKYSSVYKFKIEFSPQVFIFVLVWAFILFMFKFVRDDTKRIFHVLWRHFISSNKEELRRFIQKYKVSAP